MWQVETVYPWESALLYRDGAFQRQLAPGRHLFFALGRKIDVFRTATYSHPLLNNHYDVITADRFAARVSLAVQGKIVDARLAIERQHQYRAELNTAVAEAVATIAAGLPLETLLTDRAALSGPLTDRLAGQIAELAIEQTAVIQVIVPPEVRRMLTEVERARREGEAALERARGEHAALRSLANAARLLKDNPDLMRLRTLQAVSPTGKGATLVLGQDAMAAPKSGVAD